MGTKEKLDAALKKDLRHPINRAIVAKALYAYTQSTYDAEIALQALPKPTQVAVMKLWFAHKEYYG